MLQKLESRFDIETINKGLAVIKQISHAVPTLLNVCDERNFNKYLKALALKWKVSVTVQKLCPEIIKLQTKTHWTNIDPYSEISSETDEGQSPSKTSQTDEPSGLLFECHGGHVLQKRKCRYSTEWSRRSSSKDIYYHDMCGDVMPKKRCKLHE